MKNNFSRNFMIGVSFIVALVLLYFGVNFLKGTNVLKSRNAYPVLFSDVSGLYTSSPVFVNGFQIGLVNGIKMVSDQPIKFIVEINLEGNYRIPKGSFFEFGSDLLGSSAVSLIANESADGYYSPGDTLSGRKEADMMSNVGKILPRADSLLLHLDSFAISVNKLMNSPVWVNTLSGIEATVSELNASSKQLRTVMTTLNNNLPSLTDNISQISEDLKVVTDELANVDIEKSFKNIDETIENIKEITLRLNDDSNSLGKLTRDTQLYDSLNHTLNSVSKLLEDIRLDPEKYLSVKVKLF